MLIRKATAGEMLKLWGYDRAEDASPTARFFHDNIGSGAAEFRTIDDRGELVGELYVFFRLDDADFADGVGTAYLCAFRVDASRRGHGLGTALMDSALADLKARGFKRATIGVDDERNEKLYRRFGFNEEIKKCFYDPCSMDESMRPEHVDAGFKLLAKIL